MKRLGVSVFFAATAAILAGAVLAGSSAVVASATGSGHLRYFDENEQREGLRTFSFSARLHADGTADGQAEINNRAQDLKQHVVIDCLRVDGNLARVGGVIKRASVSAFEGKRMLFVVQDNGEPGKGPPADRFSFLFRQGDPGVTATDLNCKQSTRAPGREIEHGNIQVRGR
ncbi:MAG: hypothetical protein ABR521_04995 [Gaiellaceae bacterium]